MDKDVLSSRKLFHTLLSIDEVLVKLEQLGILKPLGIEEVALNEALGRILAEDIYAPIDYPPFDRSEVDGYAVTSRSIEGADELHPVKLRVIGKISIGETPNISVEDSVAVAIDTGAVIPRGADAVVMEEYTERVGPDEIVVYKGVVPGENIAFAGSDIAIGELVLKKGTKLTHREVGVLAALGINRVKVFKKPVVAVVSIGNELQDLSMPLAFGKVYDSNGYALTALLKQYGFEARYYGILPDNESAVYTTLTKLLTTHDVIVTSGGTSAGEGDITYKVFEKIGTIIVHGLKIKPGKPTVIALSNDGKLLFGLPGFPFSALSVAMLLLVKVLERLEGYKYERRKLYAVSAFKVRKDIGRTWLLPVILSSVGGKIFAVPYQARSGSVLALLKADGIAVLREDKELVDEGTEIEVIPLNSHPKDATIVGSHDVMLPALLAKLGIADMVSLSFVGSYKGLQLIKKGYIDISPIHLLDSATGEYNLPFIKRDAELKARAILVRGYRRRLVLAFKKGNPKNIKGIEDLLRHDIRFVNRNKGSGTRIYIDMVLEAIAKKLGQSFNEIVKHVNGYWYEVPTHNSVAAAIAQGRADVGVCTEYTAVLYGLDYIPLTWEYYDFLINAMSLSKESVRRFIEGLKTSLAREVINSVIGYEVPPDMGLKLCC